MDSSKRKIRPARYHTKPDLLTLAQVEQIHLASLQILKQTGMQMAHAKAQEVLASRGARVESAIWLYGMQYWVRDDRELRQLMTWPSSATRSWLRWPMQIW